jgi:oligopeptide transport system substrate-binding protein
MGVAGLLMLAIFLGPRRGLPVIPRAAGDEKVIRIAYTQFLLPDPHRRTQPVPAQNQFILALWEPLVECDPATGQPKPAAAESWAWSEDRCTLMVKLRPDGRWSNGERVTARDFVRGWRRLLRQPTESASTLFPLKNAEAFHRGKLDDPEKVGVEAVDDRTLRLTLRGIRSTFVAELADPLLSPIHESMDAVLLSQIFWSHPEKLVSNGAFLLERAAFDGFRLRASPHYRDRAAMQLSGAQFIRVGNMNLAQMLAAAGLVDVLAPVPGSDPAQFPTTRCLTEENELALSVSTLDLNVTRGPLRDPRVRRALSLALDRAGSIAPEDRETKVPAFAWVPDMPGRPGLTLLHEDVAEARRLLAEAGYPEGRNFPVLVLPVTKIWRGYPYLQAWTERWYQELGIRTYLAYDLEDARMRRRASGDYDIFYNGLLATVPDAGDMLATFAMPGIYNASRWENPEVTRLLSVAEKKEGAERLALLERAERITMEEVPTIPTTFEQRRTLLAIEVGGWYADPLGRQSLKNLSIRMLPVEKPAKGRVL